MILSIVNPALLAAVNVIVLLPSPTRLMLRYLIGALLTSVATGVAILFALEETDAASTARDTVAPAQDLVVGGLLLAVARSGASRHRAGRR